MQLAIQEINIRHTNIFAQKPPLTVDQNIFEQVQPYLTQKTTKTISAV